MTPIVNYLTLYIRWTLFWVLQSEETLPFVTMIFVSQILIPVLLDFAIGILYVRRICTLSCQKSTWFYWDQAMKFWGVCLIFCHQDFVPSIELDPEAERMKEHRGVFLDFNRSSMGCQMEYAIMIHLLSLIRSSLFLNSNWLSKYIHWAAAYAAIMYGSIWGCILQLHGVEMYGHLKPL